VHLTTTVDGNVLIGPSAEYIDSKENYASTQAMMDDLFREAQQLLPALRPEMIIGAYTGIRAKLVPKGQANYGDFVIEESKAVENLINLVGIESPGLTASIPIAETVAGLVKAKRTFQKKAVYKAGYRRPPVFAALDPERQDALIAADPDYGSIVCRCKTVTRAEIVQALRNPLGVQSIVGVKNRVHATRGRCQGGYCMSKITDIFIKELGIPPENIAYRRPDDLPLLGYAK
jgi:glycerol-3-phosphate dehydrogenase